MSDLMTDYTETEHKAGSVLLPLEYKEDDDPSDAWKKPVKFKGFGNTAYPDLGNDIVEPEAFDKATLVEFLKFGRQLFFMHDRYAQVGEITEAEVVAKGTRSMFGIKEGGLLVGGFVDSPFDSDTGMIPDHQLAKIIHFVRMQVKRGRLKLLSIGWVPTKSEYIEAPDPRRGGENGRFRLVKKLLLREISLVTMAMSPRAMIEAEQLRKAFAGMYGEDIASALFADTSEEQVLNRIPEKVDGLDLPTLRRILTSVAAEAAREIAQGKAAAKPDGTEGGDGNEKSAVKLSLVQLGAAPAPKFNLVTLSKGK